MPTPTAGMAHATMTAGAFQMAPQIDAIEQRSNAFAFVPKTSGSAERALKRLASAAASCTACPLHQLGTQTVFGEGAPDADLMLVGEQPGDKEDLAGRPFVGPAGGMLDKALAQAGLDRQKVYVTNAVKHFNFEQAPGSGKPRIHKKPRASHVKACQAWVIEEIKWVKPRLVLCLGATAAQGFLGASFRLGAERGQVLQNEVWGVPLMATYHPSALLRVPSKEQRAAMFEAFVHDLQAAHKYASAPASPRGKRSLKVL